MLLFHRRTRQDAEELLFLIHRISATIRRATIKGQMKIVRITTMVIAFLLSVVLPAAIVEILLRSQEAPRRGLITNLSPDELAAQRARSRGMITESYWKTYVSGPWHTPNQQYYWGGQPGRMVEFFTRVEWNNLGCHDEEDYHPSTSTRRILFLGDSFVEAVQVPHSLTFYSQLRSKTPGTTIWGCGWSGWSPTYAALNLQDERVAPSPREPGGFFEGLASLNPTEVIYFVYVGNDLRNETGKTFANYAASVGSQCARSANSSLRVLGRLIRGWNRFVHTPSGDIRCVMDEVWAYAQGPASPVADGYAALRDSILLLDAAVKKKGATLRIAVIEPFPIPYGPRMFEEAISFSYPDARAVRFDLDRPRRELSSFMESHGIPFVFLSDVFSQNRNRDDYFESDLHFSPEGHQSLARFLTEWLSLAQVN